MNHTFIDELIQNCLTMLNQLDFKESVIKRKHSADPVLLKPV